MARGLRARGARLSGYRKAELRGVDVETAALHDLLARIRRLRRRVALPAAVVAVALGLTGAVAHVTGYWAILGVLEDGTYAVHAVTILFAAGLAASPAAAVGVASYLLLRARLRRAWRDEHVRTLDAAWIDSTARRFG